MAVARMEQGYVRRYSPTVARGAPVERPAFLSARALIVGVVAAGALLQHTLVSVPLEPQPVRPSVVSALAAPAAPAPLGAPQAPTARTAHAAKVAAPASAGASHQAPAPAWRLAVAADHTTGAAAGIARATTRALVPPSSAVVLPPVGAFGDAHRLAMAANSVGAIMHVPSVSVAVIRSALRAARSPVLDAAYADHKDAAEYIWDSGRVLGVDPAVVMAFFRHESVFGTRGMARETLSVGNIRPLPGQPQVNGYRLYASWQAGIDDCYRLLRSYARNGATTVPQAVPVWAPPTDNNDDSAYIASVLGAMGALYDASVKL